MRQRLPSLSVKVFSRGKIGEKKTSSESFEIKQKTLLPIREKSFEDERKEG
jgi:hypothetical protein